MNCSHCGSWQSYDPTARFCATCGAHFAAAVTTGFESVDPRAGLTRPAPRPGSAPVARRDWRSHPATWTVAAAVVLVAGMVLAAVILASGDDSTKDAAPAGAQTPSTSAVAKVSNANSSRTAAAAPGAPRTVVTVRPGRTRTVTRVVQADGPRVPGSLSSDFATSNQADATPYLTSYGTGYFISPSGNIGCWVYTDSVDCTIAEYDFDEPGYDCPQGADVSLDYSGASVDCASGGPGNGRTLAYGTSIVNGGVACVSRSSGVSCANVSTGTGFSLSREQVLPRY